ncbi:MAG: hypothetical protein OEW12_04085, partial [Deltaproteobacteria bacterium]|nr:hypothetical protein [Deltaproteobacteria bacterium]
MNTLPTLQRILTGSVFLFLLGAMLLLTLHPMAGMINGAAAEHPALVHLLGLGGVLGGYYRIYSGLFRRLYGPSPWEGRLWPVIAATHLTGVVLMVIGFHNSNPLLIYIGGHYLLPTGICLSVLLGALMARNRPRGVPRYGVFHLPGAGLLVAMSLGALMAMDAFLGIYGIYGPRTILIHALSAGFLFVMPAFTLAPLGRRIPPAGLDPEPAADS